MSFNRSVDSNVIDLVARIQIFGNIDYGIFITMLGISSAIGLYFGIKDKQKNRRSRTRRRESIEIDYLVGGRKMKIFPVAMSLAATWVSGITFLGLSSEMYLYGSQFLFLIIAFVLTAIVVHYLFIPIYLELKITSTYEYLEARFDRKMRYFGAITFMFANILNIPILLYATALAFNQVSGINIQMISTITCLVCILYTTIGGMKAVVWTDMIQTLIMYAILIIIVIKATLQIGGLSTIWRRNYDSGRIELPPFTFDPTVRHSFLALTFGGVFQISQTTAISQLYIQRYVSLPDKMAARKALWIFTVALISLTLLCCCIGLQIYAAYYDCDPVTTRLAQSKDQLLPVFVMDVLKNFPGLAGLFVAGIFSATLSTLSTTLNSFSAVVLQDFIKTSTTKSLSKFTTNIIMQSVVLATGFICVGLVFVVEKFSALFQLKLTVTSCTSGPLLGIFLIGILLPWINSNSALFGGIVSLLVMIWITVKNQMAIVNREITYVLKPTATYGCTYNYTTVMSKPIIQMEQILPQIYHVSYMWFSFIGVSTTIIVACVASLVFGRQNPHNVNPALLAPFVRKYFSNPDRVVVKSETSIANVRKPLTETTHEFSTTVT